MFIGIPQSTRTILHCSKCLVRISLKGAASTRLATHTEWIRSYKGKSKERYNTAEHWVEPEGYHTGIKIFNSLTKRKDELILPKGKHLSWYVCGPTVYDSAHVGHASCYMRFDVIRRILQNFFDINVTYMMGVTDIDDKIIRRANNTEQDYDSVAKHFDNEFFEELRALNISSPTIKSRVTDHIPEIISFIQNIIDKGHAYPASDGSVYFDIQEYGNYHRFKPSNYVKGTSSVKKNMNDFVLWKAVKPGEPYWDSPWGGGRPGWHIECSAMASKIFGTSIDMHSGGQDLMFPHHENELAQCCSYHGTKQWSNYWIHAGLVITPYHEEKMSKSLKNTIPTSELIKQYTPNQFRLLCIHTLYGNDLLFTEETMSHAQHHEKTIQEFLGQCEAYVKGQIRGGDISEAFFMQQFVGNTRPLAYNTFITTQSSIRLEETRENILNALRNNFNTYDVMMHLNEFMQLIGKGFVEKKDISEPVCRSPATIMAASVFVKSQLRKLGFQKKGLLGQTGSDDTLIRDIMDEVVKFRWNIRDFAMKADIPLPDTMTKKKKKEEKLKIFGEVFKYCDDFRSQMGQYRICIQDREFASTWEIIDPVSAKEPSSTEQNTESEKVKNKDTSQQSELPEKNSSNTSQNESQITNIDSTSQQSESDSDSSSDNNSHTKK